MLLICVILLSIITFFSFYKYYQLKKMYSQSEEGRLKLKEFYYMLIVWVRLFQHGRSIKEFFDSRGYKNVAIYGMKEMGELLYKELKRIGVNVSYIIDRNAADIKMDIPILRPEEDLSPVDAVIVTAVHYYPEIAEYMCERIDCPIISMEDIMFYLYEYEY